MCDQLEMHIYILIKIGDSLGMTVFKFVIIKSVFIIIREAIEAKNTFGQDKVITVENSESDENNIIINI